MNKTCGECKYCERDDFGIECCDKHGICNISKTQKACSAFEQYSQKTLTNGDKIRQMSNEELASIISTSCDKCGYRPNQCVSDDEKTCYEGHLAWLNAPAESEVENE